jgi:hypothetical protein
VSRIVLSAASCLACNVHEHSGACHAHRRSFASQSLPRPLTRPRPQTGCNLGHVRADVLVARADNRYARQIVTTLVRAGQNPDFAHLFDVPSADDSIFSCFTTGLLEVDETASAYLGNFKHVMDGFKAMRGQQNVADTAAITANPDPSTAASAGSNQASSSSSSSKKSGGGVGKGWVVLTFFAALLLGLVGGAFAMRVARRRHSDRFYNGAPGGGQRLRCPC